MNDYRLTDGDEFAAIARTRETVKLWQRTRSAPNDYVTSADECNTLERLAAGAIGCNLYDLRDSELAWVANMVRVVAADVLGRSLVEVAR